MANPFCLKIYPQLLNFIESKKQILTYDILTNTSIDIKEPILERLAKSKKACKISISDYSYVPNVRLKQTSIFKNFKKYGIPYSFLDGQTWNKLDKIYKRNRSKEEIIANYHACRTKCVSLIGAGGGNLSTPKSAMFVCAAASSLSKLKSLEEFQGDYVDIENDNPKRFLEFYAQDFFKCCDYCPDCSKPKEKIVATMQTREILNIES